eukprot:m.187420 g.187420  ORF g.187420 m.187420 type:complete len:59 (+) comp18505_c1_seq12:255-431(+)
MIDRKSDSVTAKTQRKNKISQVSLQQFSFFFEWPLTVSAFNHFFMTYYEQSCLQNASY